MIVAGISVGVAVDGTVVWVDAEGLHPVANKSTLPIILSKSFDNSREVMAIRRELLAVKTAG